MLESIAWDQVGIGSGWALVTLGVVMIMRGYLVPKRFYDDMVHDRNEALASGRIKDQQLAEKDQQLSHMAEVGKTMQAILTAIHGIGGRSGGSDEEVRL